MPESFESNKFCPEHKLNYQGNVCPICAMKHDLNQVDKPAYDMHGPDCTCKACQDERERQRKWFKDNNPGY